MDLELLSQPEVTVRSVHCPGSPDGGGPGGGSREPYPVIGEAAYELCLVRSGCFQVRGDHHVDVLVDPTTCILGPPGHAVEVTHPRPGGDLNTVVLVSEQVLAALGGGSVGVPSVASTTRELAWAHRRLLACARTGVEPMAVEELALELFASAVAQSEAARVAHGAPAERHHQRLVDDARAALTTDLDLSVVELARLVGCSPHHLSRVFTRHTGHGIARHRLTLRVDRALEGLADGCSDLAQLAAICGFADHAHLSRAVRQRTGATPSALRAALEESGADTDVQAGR